MPGLQDHDILQKRKHASQMEGDHRHDIAMQDNVGS